MIARKQLYLRPDHYAVSDTYFSAVQKVRTVIDKNVISDMNMDAVGHLERLLNHYIITAGAKHLVKQGGAFLCFIKPCCIELINMLITTSEKYIKIEVIYAHNKQRGVQGFASVMFVVRRLADEIVAYKSIREFYEHLALQDKVTCALVNKEDADGCAVSFAEENGFSGRGQKRFPIITRAYPGCVPGFVHDEDEQRYLEEALNAAVWLSGELAQEGKASLGFGGEKMIPLIDGNGGDFQISLFLRPEEPAAVYPEPKARKLKKKLPRKGRVECCVVYTPLPRSDEYKCAGYEDRFCTFFLGVNTKKGGEYLLIDLFAGYIDAADKVLDCIIGGFEAKKYIPEEIDVVDERTEKLLGDFCSSNGIRLVRTDHFTEFDEVRDQVIEDMASPDDEEEMSDTDRFENVCDML